MLELSRIFPPIEQLHDGCPHDRTALVGVSIGVSHDLSIGAQAEPIQYDLARLCHQLLSVLNRFIEF
jgi:hypothetical protein